jgi:sialate O-acetylesterase
MMNNTKSIIAALLGLAAAGGQALADVTLASPFTSHMVLQREMTVPVWGSADPGEQIAVSFAGQEKSATAGPDGKWRIDLDPLTASADGRAFVVRGSRTAKAVQLDDVLVGEVWLASGQSNMEFTVSKKVKYFAGVANEEQEIAAANYPLIRMFTGALTTAYEPQGRVAGEWLVCSPETVPAFSAIGYLFARDLQKEIRVPIGILSLSYGASTAEAWIRRETMAGDPQLKPMLDRFDSAVKDFREHPPAVAAAPRPEDVAAPGANPPNAGAAKAGQGRRGRGPRDPAHDQHNATVLFNGMINPVVPYSIRGVIWYQGESIVGGAAGLALYPLVQETLVRDWRRAWGEGDFPFYIVQLAGQEASSNRPEVREAQATLMGRVPSTGMAVTTDIGEAKNVHPHDKQDVGDRLARIALANVYGRKIEYSGPVYESMKVEGGAIRVSFTHLGGGLVAKGGGPLKWFEIAGADGRYVPANGTIDGDTVVVASPQVAAPVAVRYAWVNFPDGCNLFNSAGLPAAQFRTDSSVK